jgi:hypothetical protein
MDRTTFLNELRQRHTAVLAEIERAQSEERALRNLLTLYTNGTKETNGHHQPSLLEALAPELVQTGSRARREKLRKDLLHAAREILADGKSKTTSQVWGGLQKQAFDFGDIKSPLTTVGLILKNAADRGELVRTGHQQYRMKLPMK